MYINLATSCPVGNGYLPENWALPKGTQVGVMNGF